MLSHHSELGLVLAPGDRRAAQQAEALGLGLLVVPGETAETALLAAAFAAGATHRIRIATAGVLLTGARALESAQQFG
jgi:alkanesulfonate monooxygenase SsuD/methylene tetrahydromethanopterin reductase-like flavin-dependent oxidoreductase (luciferase family)